MDDTNACSTLRNAYCECCTYCGRMPLAGGKSIHVAASADTLALLGTGELNLAVQPRIDGGPVTRVVGTLQQAHPIHSPAS